MLDSQPEMSNMSPLPTDVHDFCDFSKSYRGFHVVSSHGMYRVFGSGASKFAFSRFSGRPKKMCVAKLCRFEVVAYCEVQFPTLQCQVKNMCWLLF